MKKLILVGLILTTGIASLKAASGFTVYPLATTLATNDTLLIEQTDSATGTRSTKRTTIDTIVAQMSFGSNYIVVNKDTGPYYNLTDAKNAAVPPTTIVVYAGLYTNNNLFKNGVNWHFMPGAVVSNLVVQNSFGTGIFDDRLSGAVTSIVSGAGQFIWQMYPTGYNSFTPQYTRTPTNTLTCFGAIVVTNLSSYVSISGDSVSAGATAANDFMAAIHVRNCSGAFFDFNNIDMNLTNGPYILGYSEDSEQDFTAAGTADGIYWERGDTWIRCRRLGDNFNYGIWCNVETAATNDIYYTGDYMGSQIYCSVIGSSPRYRGWFDIKQLVANGTQAIGFYGGGRWYLRAEKLSHRSSSPVIITTTGAEGWVTVQKISSSGPWISLTGGALWAEVDEFEDLGMTTPGIFNVGGTLRLRGHTMITLNAPGIWHQGGVTDVEGLRINTSLTASSNNVPFLVKSNGLTIRNCYLSASLLTTNTYSISATGATAFVKVQNTVASHTNNVNITNLIQQLTVSTNVN